MLIACKNCHRPLEVSTLAPGTVARCFCGTLNRVPLKAQAQACMIKCGACGAAIAEGKQECEYCGAAVRFEDRGSREVCPHCFGAVAASARFCPSCGCELKSQAILKAMRSLECPSCRADLVECRDAELAFVQCITCAGIWLEEELFRRLIGERGKDASRVLDAAKRKGPPQDHIHPSDEVVYRPCPVCRDRMPRINFGSSGVILDWCGRHGYWFDADELNHLLERAARGELSWPARDAEKESEKRPRPLIVETPFQPYRNRSSFLDVFLNLFDPWT